MAFGSGPGSMGRYVGRCHRGSRPDPPLREHIGDLDRARRVWIWTSNRASTSRSRAPRAPESRRCCLLGALDRPQAGTVVIDGHDLSDARATSWRLPRDTVGFVFQHFGLLETLTAAENVSWRARSPAGRARRAATGATSCSKRSVWPTDSIIRPTAERRRAPAGRHRAGAGQRAAAGARRRADGQPRRGQHAPGDGAVGDAAGGARVHARARHPRPPSWPRRPTGRSTSARGATRCRR